MDYMKELKEIMGSQTDIAIATSTRNISNVRIVNFYYDNNNEGVVYFSTFKDNDKIKEFNENNIVSFTTIPKDETRYVRAKDVLVKKSSLSLYDLKEGFSKKIEDYGTMIEEVGDDLILYELHFSKARVIVDMMNMGEISF